MVEQSVGEKKLSRLLREYMEEKKKNPEGFLEISTALMTGGKAGDVYMVSKEFGFIERLVQNDKIDFDKCGLDVRYYLSYNKRYDKGIVMAENYDNDTFVVKEFYSPYEQLLMLLSISDTPIKDLISYLK